MNDLNSVLIEGILTGDPTPNGTEGNDAACRFIVETRRTNRAGLTRTYTFAIETKGRLAMNCNEHLRAGRGVRVVGSLAEKNAVAVIQAEHVEFRPMRPSGTEPQTATVL
jgi:single-stranded DNA-binding protein